MKRRRSCLAGLVLGHSQKVIVQQCQDLPVGIPLYAAGTGSTSFSQSNLFSRIPQVQRSLSRFTSQKQTLEAATFKLQIVHA